MRWRLYALAQHVVNNKGGIMILVAGGLCGLIGLSALSIDMGYYSVERQKLQNALDAAVLAGAQHLPLRAASAAEATRLLENAIVDAQRFAAINDNRLDLSRFNISFGCLVNEDAEVPERADRVEVLTLCPQLPVEEFVCQNGRCFQACPELLDASLRKCNTIRVTASKVIELFLAPKVGVTNPTINLESLACRGSSCGAPAEAAIVLMPDRSPSMGEAAGQAPDGRPVSRLRRAQDGAISILSAEFLDPALHEVALATTPRGSGEHILEGLTSEYARLAGSVDALMVEPGATDLHTPVEEATALLRDDPRAQRIIILLTDGAPRAGLTPCMSALNAAQAAEAAGIQVFTIFYGITNNPPLCPDDTSLNAAQLLADMAFQGARGDANANCVGENDDGDFFLCASDGEDLVPIFQQIIRQVTVGDGSSLIDLTGLM